MTQAGVGFSVVIPSHSRTDLLRDCLASVTHHAPPHTDILVVDDGSPGACVSHLAASYPDVRTIRLPRQRGFCVAANTGIAAARGAVVQLLNDDTIVLSGWAEAALPWFSNSTVAAVAPLVLLPGKSANLLIDSAGDQFFLGGVARKRGHGELLGPAYLTSSKVFGASGSSAFYRRDTLVQVGYFPEEFRAYFEDIDLSFRLNRAGYQVVYEPSSRILHRGGASHGAPRRQMLEQQSRNEERVFWRNVPSEALPAAFLWHALILAGKAWRRSCEGTFLPFWWGRLAILTEVLAILRHRRRLSKLGSGSNWRHWHLDGWSCSLLRRSVRS